MKNRFFSMAMAVLAATAFTGCAGEEDDIFSSSAAERLNESSAKYSARLMAQPNGWAMQYYPTYEDESPYGSGYLILMDFDEDYSVRVAMDNRFSNNTFAMERSLWQVIGDNGPVLSFNSFNSCMHAFSDPEDIPWTEDNEQSEGCGGDYEFIIVDAPEDASYMMLKGKKRNTYNLLTPIEEGVDYQEYLADVKSFHNKMFSANAPVGNYLNFGDSIYNIEDASDGLPSIYPLGTDKVTFENFNPFLITKRGTDYYLRFRDEFKRGDMEGKLQELRYDADADMFIGTDNSNFTITGYPAGKFFEEHLNSMSSWNMLLASNMSEKFATYMTTLDENFASMKDSRKRSYTFVGISLGDNTASKDGVRDTALCWSLVYRTPGATRNTLANYVFTATFTAADVTFNYVEPRDVSATNIANTFAVVGELTALLNRKFNIEAVETKFDVRQLKLVASDDPDLWFVVNI